MRTEIPVRVTHNTRNDSGEHRTSDEMLIDDGQHITKPSSHPAGGARIIIADSGDTNVALSRARDMLWCYWIGGAGYTDKPVSVTVRSYGSE